MVGTQAEFTSDIAQAEARVANMLLMEMMDMLKARGLVSRADIAAALLRMEWRATAADEFNKEEGDITHHAGIATLTIDEWERRFGLPPQLFVLRKEQQEWIAQGSPGESPLYPSRVIELFSDEDG